MIAGRILVLGTWLKRVINLWRNQASVYITSQAYDKGRALRLGLVLLVRSNFRIVPLQSRCRGVAWQYASRLSDADSGSGLRIDSM